MYKVIFFDQDDTLCPAKNKADKEMILLFEELLNKYRVVITSWWMFKNINYQILSELSENAKLENLVLFPTCAAKMFEYKWWEWDEKYAMNLTIDEVNRIENVFHNAIKELELVPNEIWWDILENRWTQITYSALWQEAPLGKKKIWDTNKEKRLKIISHIKNDLEGFSIWIWGTTSIDIVKNWVDKSYGVNKTMELYNIRKEEILYVWDALFPWWNDYVVVKTGIDTKRVDNPQDTKEIIRELLKS
jgi:HAD superfamily hydrolase (TIGR01484 family)